MEGQCGKCRRAILKQFAMIAESRHAVQCPASSSSPPRCPTPTARFTSATSWSTCRPTSGCASSGCRGTRSTSSAPTTRTARRSCCDAEAEGVTPEELIARVLRGPQARRPALRHQLRQLPLDALAREHGARVRDLPRAAEGGLRRNEDHRAVLRPGEGHVPARPLHQGRVPEMRRQGPVRRLVRELRRRLRAHRAEEPVLGAHRREAGAEEVRPLLLQALGPALRGVPARAGPRTAQLQPEVANKVARVARRRA